MTTAEPTRALHHHAGDLRDRERSAEVVRTSVVMMSRGWITHALLPYASDCTA